MTQHSVKAPSVIHRPRLGRLLTALTLATAMLILMRWATTPTAASPPSLPPFLSSATLPTPLSTPNLATNNSASTILSNIPIWFSEQSDLSTAAAWADVDSDGDLDLALAYADGANKLYLNENGRLQNEPAWAALDGSGSVATDLAWGDVDNDGDLDLAFGYVGHSRVYYNVNGRLQNFAAYYSTYDQFKTAASVAWADMNADGYLDLVVGVYGTNFNGFIFFANNEIYYNDGTGNLNPNPSWTAAESIHTTGIAVGDINNDGYPDIVTANTGYSNGSTTVNGAVNQVYLNNAGTIPTSASYTWGSAENATDVALGDINGDSFLDVALSNMPVIAAGNPITPQNHVYLNNSGTFSPTASWSTSGDYSQDLTWGDADGDGDLDLAVAVIPVTSLGVDLTGGLNKLYLNDNGQLATTAAWTDPTVDTTYGLAWADMNGDGQLDLATANQGGQDKVYLNQHLPIPPTANWSSPELDASMDVAWGDYDADGDLDLAVANNRAVVGQAYVGGENRIYYNQNGQLQLGWSTNQIEDSFGVAWADINNDGSLELAVANGSVEIDNGGNPPSPNRIYAAPAPGQPLDPNPIWSSDEDDDTFHLAWGDVDGDGDLDLATANSHNFFEQAFGVATSTGAPNRVYLNDNGTLETTASWVSDDEERTLAVAWGDVDGDGDLDLAVANARTLNTSLQTAGGQNKLYLNENGVLQNPAVWVSKEFEDTRTVAWGDVDGDGDLDLAAGNSLNPNRVYLNEDGQLQRKAYWFSLDQDDTYEIIWADIDGDGDLDLFAANSNGPNKIYLNENGTLNPTAVWQSDPTSATGAAIGDMDGDGDLDIATSQVNLSNGNGQANLLYQKGSPAHPLTPGQSAAIKIDLQFAGTPNSLAPAAHYAVPAIRNGLIPISYTLFHPLSQPYGSVRGFYSLDGGDNWLPAERTADTPWLALASTPYPTPTITATHVYTWDTVASGVFGQSDNVVFRLEAYPHSAPTGEHSYLNEAMQPPQRPFIATQTYPFRLRGTQVRVLSGTTPAANALVYNLPNGQSVGGQPLQDGQGIPFRTDAFGYLQGRATLAVSDTLIALMPVTTTSVTGGAMSFDGVDDYIIRNPVLSDFPQDEITVAFWMQGDGTDSNRGTPFSYATNAHDDEFLIFDYNNFSIHREFEFLPTGISANDGEWHHIALTWRGADGQAILYKDGTAVFTGTIAAGTTLDPGGSFLIGQEQDSIEGGFQDFQSFKGLLDEFEVWNKVLTSEEITDGYENGRLGTEDGLVLYWNFDENSGQRTLDQSNSASHGRVEGPTRIGIPGGYTVYYTNGQPQETAVTAHTISATAIQTLTVSAANPLILFDVDVSLEWDASQDPAYLEQLEFDLQKASAYLYDFTDGQVALGEVTVSQNGDNWLFSDVVVRSTNRLRPFAIQGGIVLTPTVDPHHPDILYTTGQVSMGSTWNRYGNAGQNLGGDWSVILAHELAHYFLFLDDTYLGINENGLLVPVDSCTGSAMGDPYTPNNTEFLTAAEWLPKCAETLAHQTLERSEWETLELWYPWLQPPTAPPYNAGPTLMPFGFTTVNILDPEKPGEPIIDPTFYIDYAAAAVSSSEASGYLLGTAADTGNDYVVALGNPATGQNRLLARGAAVGNRLCVFDPARQQYGCETVAEGDNRLQLEHDETWRPFIQISPVNSTTVDIQLTLNGGPSLPVRARLFPDIGPGTEVVTLTERTQLPDGRRIYSETVTLDVPALAGHIQLWVDEPATETDLRREIIIAYGIGGNPGIARGAGGIARGAGGIARGAGGIARGAGGIARGAGGIARGAGGIARGAGGIARGAGAPLLSPDGQFILFTENPADFAAGELYAIQQLANLPPLPTGKSALGSSYQLVASPNVTRIITGSVSFQYLGLDALNEGIDENKLTIHFWNGIDWEALETTRDSYYNLASADSSGVGIYALLAGVTQPQVHTLDPALITNDSDSQLIINGADFLRPVQVQISASQGTFTLPLTAVTETTISATIPAGLPAAEYQLTVINGDGGLSAQAAALAIFDPAAACFYDFFDSGSSQWTISGDWGIVELPDNNLAITDSPQGNYLSAMPSSGNRTTTLTSIPFSLAACTDAVLTFDHEFVLASGVGHQDSGRVEISADGGTNWDTLASYSGGGLFGEPHAATADAPASPEWLGDSWRGGWFDLSNYDGLVQIRFVLATDEAVADKGWLLDNILVRPRTAAAPTAELELEASYSGAAEIESGETAVYTLTAINNGADVLAVTVSAEFPAAALGTISCSDSCMISGNSVSWDLPALFSSHTLTVALETAATYSDTLILTADIAAPQPDWQDGNSSNNTAVVSAPAVSMPPAAEPTADLGLTLSYDGAATITTGQTATYTLNVVNNGPDILPVVVNFSAPVTAVSSFGCAAACAPLDNTVNWLLPAFTGSQTLTVTLTTAATYSGTLDVAATVTSPTPGYIEINSTNNQAQLTEPAVITTQQPPPPEEPKRLFLPLLTR